ncbi:MAG: glycosyltransferase family 9 protein [Aquificaceae bacterium]
MTFPILELLKKAGKKIWAVGNTDYLSIAKEVGWADFISSEIPEGEFEERVLISYEGNVSPFPKNRVWIVKHYLESLNLPFNFSKSLPLKPLDKSPLEGKVLLHPSSGSFKKNPPLELFLRIEEFLRKEGLKALYVIGEADQWLKAYVKEYFESLSPLELAKALKTAKLFIGLDSGMSHLASYCGLPTMVFYGPTDPVIWRPIGDKIFQISLSLDCSPCFPHACDERKCFELESLFEGFERMFKKVPLCVLSPSLLSL